MRQPRRIPIFSSELEPMPIDIEKEIRDHPDRFDYQDVPDLKINPAYRAAMDALQPDWVKEAVQKARLASDR